MLHIHVVGPDGRLDRSFSPLIDGTMGDSDALFELLKLYLPLLLNLKPARILLIADGAPSIWKRVTAMIEKQVLAGPFPVIQLIDFYHAVEHLGQFAELCTFWPSARACPVMSR